MNLGEKFAQEAYGRAEIVSFCWPIVMLNSLKTIVGTTFCQNDFLFGFLQRIDIQNFMTIGGSPCILIMKLELDV